MRRRHIDELRSKDMDRRAQVNFPKDVFKDEGLKDKNILLLRLRRGGET